MPVLNRLFGDGAFTVTIRALLPEKSGFVTINRPMLVVYCYQHGLFFLTRRDGMGQA